jgi:hypothetical protein
LGIVGASGESFRVSTKPGQSDPIPTSADAYSPEADDKLRFCPQQRGEPRGQPCEDVEARA